MIAFKALLRLLRPITWRTSAALLVSGLSGVLRVLALVAIGDVVRLLLEGDPQATAVAWRVGLALAAVVAGSACRSLSSTISHHAAFDHEVMLRTMLTTHLARIPLGEVQRIGSGGLKKVIQSDVRGIHALVADTPPPLGATVTTPVVAVIAMLVIDWRLGLVVLLLVPVALAVMSLIFRDHKERREAYDRAQEAIGTAVVEYVHGMQEVRTFDGGTNSFSRFEQRNQAFTDALAAWTRDTQVGTLLTRVIVSPLPVIVVATVAGARFVTAGWVSVPELVTILLLAPLAVESFVPLVWLSQTLSQASASVVRLDEVLAIEPLPEPENPRTPADGRVEFRGVAFQYEKARGAALRGLDLDVPAGTVCALVGASGSGKSTIARLAARFWDVSEGSISIGGVDVREMDQRTLHRSIAMVFQEPFLLHASVRENLTLGLADVSDADVEAATRAAQAHDFVLALPDGYDTVVGERGASLSGGQRQRLTIARALLTQAPVVILDEATSFADPENEAAIQAALAELTRGRTVLVVAHRLSTIVDADQIAVLAGGAVVESGRHEELLAREGAYASMWSTYQRAQEWGLGRPARQEAGREVVA